ncbi:GDSL-type esterase/lipase family protein [Paenibacillus sp. NPDC058071]|uniref:GDSL-type esterase/lipase family protein n=1 Tax=Paenibacillus sp. NPDC058071 TaxID=3346326 RepID=UPI0036D7F2CE
MEKTRRAAAVAAALALFSLTLWTGSAYGAAVKAPATPKNDGIFRIVALGDSITAGYEKGFSEQDVPYGYVEHIYEQALFRGLRAEYANFGILGLKTAGLERLLSAAEKGLPVRPDDIQRGLPDPRAAALVDAPDRIGKAIRAADLIVMTIGGNDLYAVVESLESDAGAAGAEKLLDGLLDDYERQLTAVVGSIRKLQPNVQIAIADQYVPIPAPLKLGALVVPLYPEIDRQFLLRGTEKLTERLERIASKLSSESSRIGIVPIGATFRGNELKLTSVADGDVHPNRLGYKAIGFEFTKSIWGGYRTVRTRGEEVPVSVVANGKELSFGAHSPVRRNGTIFMPVNDAVRAAGGTISWSKDGKTAAFSGNGHNVRLTIGSAYATVDGSRMKLNSPPAYIHRAGRETVAYMPIAVLAETLRTQVVYRSTIQTVFINR